MGFVLQSAALLFATSMFQTSVGGRSNTPKFIMLITYGPSNNFGLTEVSRNACYIIIIVTTIIRIIHMHTMFCVDKYSLQTEQCQYGTVSVG